MEIFNKINRDVIKDIFLFIHPQIRFKLIKYNKHLKTIIDLNLDTYIKNFSLIKVEVKYKEFNILQGPFFTKNIIIKYLGNNKKLLIYKYNAFPCFIYDNYISIRFKQIDRINFTSLKDLLSYCSDSIEIDLSNINTINVTNMSYMFNGCSSLKKLNINQLNTSNVTDMSFMFNNCSSLENLILDNFNTSNVEDMAYMFNGCRSLKLLNLNNFNTSNVINMSCMFSGCTNLYKLYIDNFDFNKVEIFDLMFFSSNYNLCQFIKNKYPKFPKKAFTQYLLIDLFES